MERIEVATGNGAVIPSDTLVRQKQLADLQAQAESATTEPAITVEQEQEEDK